MRFGQGQYHVFFTVHVRPVKIGVIVHGLGKSFKTGRIGGIFTQSFYHPRGHGSAAFVLILQNIQVSGRCGITQAQRRKKILVFFGVVQLIGKLLHIRNNGLQQSKIGFLPPILNFLNQKLQSFDD